MSALAFGRVRSLCTSLHPSITDAPFYWWHLPGVTEGFQRTVSVPADPLAANKRLPFTQTPSFISSNDAMRELLAARAAKHKSTSSAPSSPQQRPKRTHGGPDSDEDADLDDDEMNLDEDEPTTASSARAARELASRLQEEKSKREIRPLKRKIGRAHV